MGHYVFSNLVFVCYIEQVKFEYQKNIMQHLYWEKYFGYFLIYIYIIQLKTSRETLNNKIMLIKYEAIFVHSPQELMH